jgi:hypothetical protein
MIPRFVGIVGVFLMTTAVCGPVQAFSDDSTKENAPAGSSRNDPSEQPPAEYLYSGNNFNFSMSRHPSPLENTSASQETNPEPPPRSRPGFFQRVIHSIFGDD